MTPALSAQDLRRFEADYPGTRNTELAPRYGMTVQQVRHLARSHGWKKGAYLAQGPLVAPRLPAERIPLYPSPFYCLPCGFSNGHAPGCKGTGRDGRMVAPPPRIRRDVKAKAAA